MKHLKLFENYTKNKYDIVYRGQPIQHSNISPRKSIWVTYEEDFAKEYGLVTKYKLPKGLNILDTDDYIKWESLIDSFENVFEIGHYVDYEEYKYEPSDEFISFLISNEYDGFMNGDNILIFDKNKLSSI